MNKDTMTDVLEGLGLKNVVGDTVEGAHSPQYAAAKPVIVFLAQEGFVLQVGVGLFKLYDGYVELHPPHSELALPGNQKEAPKPPKRFMFPYACIMGLAEQR